MDLPDIIDFDEFAHPELSDIFRGIDAGIAAIVAADPTLRPKPLARRPRASMTKAKTVARKTRNARSAAA